MRQIQNSFNFEGNLRIQLPRYCNKLYNEGTRGDGIYDVIANGNRIEVFCEFEKNGHNWLVSGKFGGGFIFTYLQIFERLEEQIDLALTTNVKICWVHNHWRKWRDDWGVVSPEQP